MSEPFLGELKLQPWTYAPRGWALCNGQLLPINQNQPLFALLGTTYGGNGQTNFALPDLRGRVPIHIGGGFSQGQSFGEAAHTVTASEMPAHSHLIMANSATATDPIPANESLASSNNLYAPFGALTTISPGTIATVGGSQPHENRQPYIALNWMIALQGIFPSQN
jgi:microcystin-dependent protein